MEGGGELDDTRRVLFSFINGLEVFCVCVCVYVAGRADYVALCVYSAGWSGTRSFLKDTRREQCDL